MASVSSTIGGRRMAMVGLLACVAALGGSAVVQGADGPHVTQAPTIVGSSPPRVGQTLNANGGKWSGSNGTTANYQWLRCTDPTNPYSCSILSGATSPEYKLVDQDLSKRMRVALVAHDLEGNSDYAISDAVGPVAPAAPAQTPTPTPTPPPPRATPTPRPAPRPTVTPAPVATPTPTPEPAFDVAAAPAASPVPTGGAVLRETATSRRAKMLQPFPTVRIRGRLTADGARVTSLTVTAPKGVRITVACTGSGCPARKLARSTKVTHLSTFERVIRAGTRLTIQISKTGYVSKVTVLRFRLGAAPVRSDGCLYPGQRRTQRCPGA